METRCSKASGNSTPKYPTKEETTMFKKFAHKMLKDESGQALAEYGLILALIAVICIGALTLLGTNVSATLGNIAGQL